MRNFEIRVTQPMIGYYYGWLNVEAENEEDALDKIMKMNNKEIDDIVHWEIEDEIDSDYENINIEFDTLTEI